MFWNRKSTKTNTQQLDLEITGMHCASCAMNIDGTLEELDGVTQANTHFAKGVTTVEFDPSVTNLKQIQAAVAELGYTAAPRI